MTRAFGQSTATFEVVSIVPNKSFERGGTLRFQPGGRFQGRNVYVVALISAAFGEGRPLLPARIDGGPDWIRLDRFDIDATTSGTVEDMSTLYGQLPVLLRPVLEDRFHLKTHWETRDLQVYVLARARKDGSLGPKVRRSNCTPRPESIRTGAGSPDPAKGRPLCDVKFGAGLIDGTGLSMLSLAGVLSTNIGRVVLDRTGLPDTYDVTLQWGLDDIPSLPTALQEQLGLKLESTRAPVDVLVIDHVERPTPN